MCKELCYVWLQDLVDNSFSVHYEQPFFSRSGPNSVCGILITLDSHNRVFAKDHMTQSSTVARTANMLELIFIRSVSLLMLGKQDPDTHTHTHLTALFPGLPR